MKKKVLVLAICVVISALFVSSAMAAFDWHVCTISKAGTTSFDQLFIEVTGVAPDTTPKTIFMIPAQTDPTAPDFAVSQTRAKEMYAAALTAWANSANVWVYCDPVLGSGSPAAGVAAYK
jgi:hypothetical protein